MTFYPIKLWSRLWNMILFADTRPTRVFLAMVATLWVATLALPGNTLERPVYEEMAKLGGEPFWMLVWGLVAIGKWWRALDFHDRSPWTVIIDFYSLSVFSSVAGFILLSKVWPFPSAVAADLVCVLAALWVAIRTQSPGKDPGYV